MKNVRIYGPKPFAVAIIHGGPGMPGYVWSVARELSKDQGVLEPIQTKNTFEGQVQELRDVLEKNADLPATLIGHSWGAFLGFVLTGRHPALVKKLILIGSGPFEEKYADNIEPDRLNRLGERERIEAFRLLDIIDGAATAGEKDNAMARLGELFARADTFDALPLEKEPEPLPVSEAINRRVWAEAKPLRTSGELPELGKRITCPVLAIHGDYDPHLAAGVREPLSRVIKDFRFILLEECGHYPWRERYARDKFYEILKKEISL